VAGGLSCPPVSDNSILSTACGFEVRRAQPPQTTIHSGHFPLEAFRIANTRLADRVYIISVITRLSIVWTRPLIHVQQLAQSGEPLPIPAHLVSGFAPEPVHAPQFGAQGGLVHLFPALQLRVRNLLHEPEHTIPGHWQPEASIPVNGGLSLT